MITPTTPSGWRRTVNRFEADARRDRSVRTRACLLRRTSRRGRPPPATRRAPARAACRSRARWCARASSARSRMSVAARCRIAPRSYGVRRAQAGNARAAASMAAWQSARAAERHGSRRRPRSAGLMTSHVPPPAASVQIAVDVLLVDFQTSPHRWNTSSPPSHVCSTRTSVSASGQTSSGFAESTAKSAHLPGLEAAAVRLVARRPCRAHRVGVQRLAGGDDLRRRDRARPSRRAA